MQYFEEYRANNVFDIGFDDKSAHIIVNSVGFFTTEDMGRVEPLTIYRKSGRRDYLLCFVVEGIIKVDVGDESYEISEGVFIYRPNRKQFYRSINTSGPLTLYWIHFTGDSANEIMNYCGLEGRPVYKTGTSLELVSAFKKLIDEMRAKQHAYEGFTASLVEYVLSLVARLSEGNMRGKAHIDKRISTALNYIHSNYQKDLDVPELAEMANLSVSWFSSLFNEYMGMFPKAYITRYRIGKSCEMIKNTDFPIGQIAFFAGFEDPLYFSRIFKKYMHMSPSKYAEQVKSNIFL